MREKPDLSVRYADRILDVLEALAQASTPLGLNELSAVTGINKTTVYRILTTLQRRYYVRQTAQHQYTNGPNWFRYGYIPNGSQSDMAKVREILRDLRDAQGETVHLAVYHPIGYAVYIDVIESLMPLRTAGRIGTISPAYCISTGKALLAHQKREDIEIVCQSLVMHTEFTQTNPERFKAHLEVVREKGFAINQQEYQKDVCGVAVPLFTSYGEVFAAAGYCVPASRFTDERIVDLLESLNHHLKDFVPQPEQRSHIL